ncbi:FAD-binding oxidoreductase [Conyzicola nivalis]|uniref:FAD-linked oxidase n=1 Tax=Conyzicola nivalis TaxID=1477021 RepID=A0A916SFZ5_9MICO|nr:FAD-binding oxidoreductase [Conyzicola nivalis]GGA95453.1 FAD-linked oxidase [Conyzicola nivalis]
MTTYELDDLGTTRILLPGDDDYTRASTVFARAGSPAIVVQPVDENEVAAAVDFARDNRFTLSVRGGGHSGGGYGTNDGGVVIDLSLLAAIDVLNDGIVRVGGGATWGAVAAALRDHDLAISSGDTSTVGVGGLTLGGGFGWMVREHGLALDQLVEARVVLADGDVVTANETDNADLFWALRGGGGNFGIVTSFTFRAHHLDGVVAGAIQFEPDDLATLLRGWRDVMREAPERLNTTFLWMPSFPGMQGGPQITVCFAGSDDEAADAAIAPLLELGAVTGNTVAATAYAEILAEAHAPDGVRMVNNNAFAAEFDDATINDLAGVFAKTPSSVLMIRYLRGAFNRVEPDATAFAYRDSEVLVISAAFFPPDAPDEAVAAYQSGWDSLLPHLQGLYGNFSMLTSDVATPLMYPPATLARLEAVKAELDPFNLFDQNHNIRPRAVDWR